MALSPSPKGTLEASKGTVPFGICLARTLQVMYMYIKLQLTPGWNDFHHLCSGMLQRIYGMRMRLLASLELCLRGHYQMLKSCARGEESKQRITLAFIVNAAGGKEVPFVIGRAASPRCLNSLQDNKNPLGISYCWNKLV